MTPLSELLQQGSAHAWLFIPSAILLGALHGLEPGHSKTMMAAFIIAVRGTVAQAILLGLAAIASHTVVVCVVALGGLRLGSQWSAESSEPYFQVVSGSRSHSVRRPVGRASAVVSVISPLLKAQFGGYASVVVAELAVHPGNTGK